MGSLSIFFMFPGYYSTLGSFSCNLLCKVPDSRVLRIALDLLHAATDLAMLRKVEDSTFMQITSYLFFLQRGSICSATCFTPGLTLEFILLVDLSVASTVKGQPWPPGAFLGLTRKN